MDADNGDGAYTCTPYWAAPQPAHHRPDGTLTQAGEASVKRRMSAPTMTRPDHITLPNGGESVQDGQRIRVKHGRTGRISVVEVVAAAGGGPDVTDSYADAATCKVKRCATRSPAGNGGGRAAASTSRTIRTPAPETSLRSRDETEQCQRFSSAARKTATARGATTRT